MSFPRQIVYKYLFKIIALISVILCVYLMFSNFSKNAELRKLKKQHKTEIQLVKDLKEAKINASYKRIAIIKKENTLLLKRIFESQHRYDSLETVKSNIRIVYKDRIKEIESFNSKQTENYWKNEFN